ncbi:T-complex protein 1 subunit theta-like [Schistocerca gregaria]|uniref:T-complex protein 1 subunit theta-like n=1 Tax=Schistocerca gregaria TaxID=7010 RepID=UPI00211E6311|nr:T-complex protein 1 subunit theta-like [Schistocerca gregaria]
MSLQYALLKEGTRHLSGVDEAVFKNIEAIKDMSRIIKTSFGPQGMSKILINSHERLFVTKDSSTVLKELDIFHPAAKLVVMNATRQQEEVGDATNLMVSLCGELLAHAESLLRIGLHISDIITGYMNAGAKSLELLNTLSVSQIDDLLSQEQVTKFFRPVIMSKQYGFEDTIAPIVAKACIQICPKNPATFDVDNVRTVKILGGAVTDMLSIKGIVFPRDSEGTIKRVRNAKVAVFANGLDQGKPETKDVYLVTSPDQLEGYQKSEEDRMEKIVKEIVDAGVTVVVCHGKVSELAMHFLERYQVMVIKLMSKFDITRTCKAVGAVPVLRMGAPTPDELGVCDDVYVEEIAGTKIVVFSQSKEHCRISTIILRGATENILDDLERAVENAVSLYKVMTRDPRFVAGAGATEMELATKLKSIGQSISGQDQYAFKKFAEAFEIVPRTLAENSGNDSTVAISDLYAEHTNGNQYAGFDIENGIPKNVVDLGIFDHLASKERAIFLATDATISVLKVDQILMCKPASGPKPPKMRGPDDHPGI